ncbi:glycosyltransferase family 4 protein [Patescibacteria group bacterium]|nr:glycosyltransferase family 4 protein [Patescibacteria group bacterium]
MKVLQLTVHLFPNVGGVETHLSDLFDSLVKKNWKVFALAYQPLSTETEWKIFEKEKNLTILRIPWLRGFFERLVQHPILEFIYLVPGLFFLTPFAIGFYKPDVLHAHGISAAVSAVFWGKIFKIRTIVSLHSIYSFPKQGLYCDFVKLIFSNCDIVLSLSKKSSEEIRKLGIKKEKLSVFTYWVDLQKFKKIPYAKKILGLEGKFIILFVGRLIEEKGIKFLLESASSWNKKINLLIVGSGPMEEYVREQTKKLENVSFIGKVDQADIRLYYSAADCIIVPSVSEEGFGRVIIESLACQTPVVASARGAIPEAMDKTVGRFIEATPENIKDELNYLYGNPSVLKKLADKARKFVERRYSESNVQTIIKAYKG